MTDLPEFVYNDPYARLLEITEPPAAGERGAVRPARLAEHLAVSRAVLELHKPELFGGFMACLACSPGMPPPILVMWSDCETIKAIADALGVARQVEKRTEGGSP